MKKKTVCSLLLLFLALNLSAQFLKPDEKETLRYRVIPKNGESYNSSSYYSAFTNDSGETQYRYKVLSPKDDWDIVAGLNGAPETIHYNDDKGDIQVSFDSSGAMVIEGVWKGQTIYTEGLFSPGVTLENTLYLRTMDLYPGSRRAFQILNMYKLPKLKTFTVAFEVIGTERVEVAAGVFDCWKVLFSLDGAGANLFKSYYYVTRDENQRIVLMDKLPMVGRIELESIQ